MRTLSYTLYHNVTETSFAFDQHRLSLQTQLLVNECIPTMLCSVSWDHQHTQSDAATMWLRCLKASCI